MFAKSLPYKMTLLILLLLPCCGCWDQLEIKEQSMVIGFGIDKISGAEPYQLTVQLINPHVLQSKNGNTESSGSNRGGMQGNNPIILKISQGRSFAEAIRNFAKNSPRHINFYHNQVIIFGKNLAQSGVISVLDVIVRDPQFRSTNWIFTVAGTALEVLQAQTGIGSYPAKDLGQMMQHFSKNAFIPPVNRNNFIAQLKSEAKAALTPVAEVEKTLENPAQFKIEKMAVFHNYRLVNILTPTESQTALWFQNGLKGAALTFPFQSGKARHNVSLEISNGTLRVNSRIASDGQILLNFFCTGKGMLRESEGIHNNPKTIQRLEHQTEQILERNLEQLIYKAQQSKIDFLGFARIIHSNHPAEWRQIKQHWQTAFPRIKTRVAIRVNLVQFGITRDSLNIID